MIDAYKGYVPEIWYDADDKAFHAIAQGIRSIIHAEAETLEDIQKEFSIRQRKRKPAWRDAGLCWDVGWGSVQPAD